MTDEAPPQTVEHVINHVERDSAAPQGLVRRAAVCGVCLVFLAAAGGAAGQGPPPPNPRGGDPEANQVGADLYRQRCAECHGADGRGVTNHDLTRLWAFGATDVQVFVVIRSGVPNTLMPSSSASDDDIWAIVAYLRSLNAPAGERAATGNPAAGARVFEATCSGCHMVNGRGGRLGPDLSRAGVSQSPERLTRAVRTPSATLASGYQPVMVVMTDGRRIRGVRKSEDAFSIQIMDTQERLQGYLKADVQEVVYEARSLMPDFGPDRLSDGDVNDLLAFLQQVGK
jgi:cytochrome c oxidase cbb3-type subunit III